MSRKPVPMPPDSLRERNPDGYLRAVSRAGDRALRRELLLDDRRRAAADGYRSLARWRASGCEPRRWSVDVMKATAEPFRTALAERWREVGRRGRLSDLAARGYVWTGKAWRYPKRERVTR